MNELDLNSTSNQYIQKMIPSVDKICCITASISKVFYSMFTIYFSIEYQYGNLNLKTKFPYNIKIFY